jgi:hypothetical protein
MALDVPETAGTSIVETLKLGARTLNSILKNDIALIAREERIYRCLSGTTREINECLRASDTTGAGLCR